MREIELTGKKYPNMVAVVDDEDYEWLNQWRWFCAGDPRTKYAVRTQYERTIDPENGTTLEKWNKVRMHNVIMNPPAQMEVDHKDGNGLNNQRANLRICTRKENMRNRKRLLSNSSGYIGVQKTYKRKTGECWVATIWVDDVFIPLGLFSDPIEAAQVRDEAAKKYHGEFANLNFPEDKKLEVKAILPDPDFKPHRLSEEASRLRTTGIYDSWLHMRQRCMNPRSKDWSNYGGRGITVCDRWQSFDAFVEDMGKHWKSGLTLERIDHNGNYTPENCTWIRRYKQNKNRRNVRLVQYRGRTQSMTDWLRELKIDRATTYRLVKEGMTFPEAFDELVKRHSQPRRDERMVEYQGKSQSVSAWARELGIERRKIYHHAKQGMSFVNVFEYLSERQATIR